MTDQPQRIAILGASGGIGSELARRLAQRGDAIALGGRDDAKLNALASDLSTKAFTHAFDATEPGQTELFLEKAAEELGGLDGVVNCIGSILIKPCDRTSDEEFENILRVNLWTAFSTVRASIKHLRSNGGSIVLMSTAAAQTGLASHEAIAAAKGGVTSLARSAAATYATNNIRVNVVAPGLVNTQAAAGIVGNKMALQASTAMHALGRIGEPEDVAPLIALLLSRDAAWITGQVIGTDGGLATLRTRVKV